LHYLVVVRQPFVPNVNCEILAKLVEGLLLPVESERGFLIVPLDTTEALDSALFLLDHVEVGTGVIVEVTSVALQNGLCLLKLIIGPAPDPLVDLVCNFEVP